MGYIIRVNSKISSSHYLRGYSGKCDRAHGHNFFVEMEIEGGELDKIGILIDFRDAKRILNEFLDKLDHTVLNETEYFKDLNPTAENIAMIIYENTADEVSDISGGKAKVSAIKVWETDENCAEYRP
ncbi:MAG: 6-carboxytetrahydropterin synthase QueD [Candidatus Coatesbacteria bacterium]|nr:MAG: 6-carboxytetrahydropterin synthase QueD [Candidatus Coatesbacteria bacterium]